MFDPWGGGIRELAERGFVYYSAEEKKIVCIFPDFSPIPEEEEAELELARRYFTKYAPATVNDAMYFFHVSAKKNKKWLSFLPVKSSEYGGKTYFYIERGEKYNKEIPRCIFLAGFDPLMLGYEKKESVYFSHENIRDIFTLSGIIMPSVLLDGKIVEKWKNKNGIINIKLFDAVSESECSIIKEYASNLFCDIRNIRIDTN